MDAIRLEVKDERVSIIVNGFDLVNIMRAKELYHFSMEGNEDYAARYGNLLREELKDELRSTKVPSILVCACGDLDYGLLLISVEETKSTIVWKDFQRAPMCGQCVPDNFSYLRFEFDKEQYYAELDKLNHPNLNPEDDIIGVYLDRVNKKKRTYSFRKIDQQDYVDYIAKGHSMAQPSLEAIFIASYNDIEDAENIDWYYEDLPIIYIETIIINSNMRSITYDVVSDMIVEYAIEKRAKTLRLKLCKHSIIARKLEECGFLIPFENNNFCFFEENIEEQDIIRQKEQCKKEGHFRFFKQLIKKLKCKKVD